MSEGKCILIQGRLQKKFSEAEAEFELILGMSGTSGITKSGLVPDSPVLAVGEVYPPASREFHVSVS